MKFGFRVPSLKKRVAARTSWKRFARHNLGLKAPRGAGWLTNPKKAAYNRVYNRTTFGLGSFPRLGSGSRSGSQAGMSSSGDNAGCGCAVISVAILVGLITLFAGFATAVTVSVLAGAVGVAVGVPAWRIARREEQRQRDMAVAQLEAAREEKRRAAAARRENLVARFGEDIATRIELQRLWQGATEEMVTEAFGPPEDVKERVLKTKTKTIYCYERTVRGGFALKITVEKGVVVGWDDNR